MSDTVILNGKVGIVTGATSGIGLAIAEGLCAEGVKLVLTGRNPERLEAVTRRLSDTASVLGDITEPELPQRLIDTALENFGRCDIVVNNAGMVEAGPIEHIDIDRVCESVRVNVEAAFRVAYTALKHFVQAGDGHLLNISSVLGTTSRIYVGAYAGTKHAIEALSHALRLELARTPVQVTCIQPGLVMTDLHRNFPVHPKEPMKVDTPLEPEDVVDAVIFALTRPKHATIPSMMILPKDHKT